MAAVGDLHYGKRSREQIREHFKTLHESADVFLIAGDLTQAGTHEEASALCRDLEQVKVPTFAVLGNHDYHSDQEHEIRDALEKVGVTALEGNASTLKIGSHSVGIVGLKGFGGGFGGACCTEFGEPETKQFARHASRQAGILRRALADLDTDYTFVLLHYSPVEGTLLGEKKEIYPFLGSYLLAESIDQHPVTCVFHGHAHLGTEKGQTPGGVPVRNVAQAVIRHAFKIYRFDSPNRASAEFLSSVSVQ